MNTLTAFYPFLHRSALLRLPKIEPANCLSPYAIKRADQRHRCLVVRPECRLSRPTMPFVQTGIRALITLPATANHIRLTMSRVDDLHRDQIPPGTFYLLIFGTVRYTWYSTFVIRLSRHGIRTASRPPPKRRLRSITLALSFDRFEVHSCLITPDVNS